jgi:8-oxo-dGTP pyrophosphatase MutT (NUDIX family)/ribosomal protein S18 acetylase RimI-like enzyme
LAFVRFVARRTIDSAGRDDLLRERARSVRDREERIDVISRWREILGQDTLIGREKYFSAAVLALFCRQDGEWVLVFEKRASCVRQGDEICFPGGAKEPGDATFAETAVRETMEELGVGREDIRVLGKLGTLVTPGGALIEAYLGELDKDALASAQIDPREVACLLTVPFSFFVDHAPETYGLAVETLPYGEKDGKRIPFPAQELGLPQRYHRPWRQRERQVYLYKHSGEIIWGITAEIVYEIVQRWTAGHKTKDVHMADIRDYREEDAPDVGRLIADTFRAFNLSYASPEEQELLLGPFRHARSPDAAHRQAIAEVIQAPMMWVAQDGDKIVGVLRGKTGRLHSLFVDGSYHGQGIGRRLVTHFEQACLQQGATAITLGASLYAIPFYTRLGYKKSTGVRSGPCFDGRDFPTQPMKKVLRRA